MSEINYKKELDNSLKKFFLKLLKKPVYVSTVLSMHAEYKKKSINFMANSLLQELSPHVSILMSPEYDAIFDKKLFDNKITLEHMRDEKEYTIKQLRLFYLYATGITNKEKAKKMLINRPELFTNPKKTNEVIPNEMPPAFGGFLGDLAKDIMPKLSKLDLSKLDMTNPMSIMQNKDIQDIIKDNCEKLKDKVDSGELDKETLKQDMDTMMPAVNKLMPGNLQDMMKQFGDFGMK